MIMFENDIIKLIEISEDGVCEKDGKYALMRLNFLQNFKEDELSQMIKDDIITKHLLEIELKAENRIEEIVSYQTLPKEKMISEAHLEDYLDEIRMFAEKQVEEELIFN